MCFQGGSFVHQCSDDAHFDFQFTLPSFARGLVRGVLGLELGDSLLLLDNGLVLYYILLGDGLVPLSDRLYGGLCLAALASVSKE